MLFELKKVNLEAPLPSSLKNTILSPLGPPKKVKNTFKKAGQLFFSSYLTFMQHIMRVQPKKGVQIIPPPQNPLVGTLCVIVFDEN